MKVFIVEHEDINGWDVLFVTSNFTRAMDLIREALKDDNSGVYPDTKIQIYSDIMNEFTTEIDYKGLKRAKEWIK